MENMQFSDIIELNVGGKQMTTLLSILTKDPESTLAAMFSGRQVIRKDKVGRYFIDCDAKLFRYILNFLRFGTLPPKEKTLEMYDIATHYNVQSLVKELEVYQTVQFLKKIKEIKGHLDLREYERTKRAVIEKLYKENVKPQDSKTVLIHKVCECERTGSYCPIDYKDCENSYLDFEIKIPIATNCDITEAFKLCLAHELCKLGFGVFMAIDRYPHELRRRFNESAHGSITCHHIMLLTQESMQILGTKNDTRLVQVASTCV